MWNTIHNPSLNSYYKFIDHKGHLERMLIMKPEIDTTTPFVPKFFQNHAGSIFSSYEKRRQINIDNRYLYNKFYQINLHPSRYSKEKNIPSRCPAFESLTYNKKKYYRNIDTENKKLKKRFIDTRPVVNYKKFERDYQRSLGYKKNISNTNDNKFPCLKFDTFHNFQKKIMNIIENDDIDINKRSYLKKYKISDDLFKRPMSASVKFNNSKKLFSNYNKNKDKYSNIRYELKKNSQNYSQSSFFDKNNSISQNNNQEKKEIWLD